MGIDTEHREAGPGAAEGPDAARTDAFISYAHEDRPFAIGLRDALQRRGKHVWVDEREIRPASLWAEDLRRAITGADAFVFVMTPASLHSGECRKELEHAASLNKRILPVNRGVVADDTVPELLRSRQFIPARGVFELEGEDALDQLVAAIDTDLDWVRHHTDWGEKATEWTDHDRDRSFLLSGAELTEAETWLAGGSGKQPEPTDVQRRFVLESRRAATRRTRTVLGAALVALAVALVLAALALIERGQADHQRDVALAQSVRASAQNLESSEPPLAALLAAEADTRQPNLASQDVLRTALAGLREEGHLAGGFFAEISSDGIRAVTFGGESGGVLWSLPQRRALLSLRDASSATFGLGADGRRLAVFGLTNGDLDVVDASNARAVGIAATGLPSVTYVVAATQAPVAVAMGTTACVIVDLVTGTHSPAIDGCQAPEISPRGTLVAFDPNGLDGSLELLDRADGTARRIQLAGDDTLAVTFPNESDVAVTEGGAFSGGAGLWVYDTKGRIVLRLPDVESPVFTPNGHAMVATELLSSSSSLVGRFAFPSGRLEVALDTVPVLPKDVELSGDGTVAAVAEDESDLVTLIDTADGRALAELHPPGGVSNVALDTTGSRLLTYDTVSSVHGVDATPVVWAGVALPARAQARLPASVPGASLALASDGGRALVSGVGRACLVSIPADDSSCLAGSFADAALSPDGTRAIAEYGSGRTKAAFPLVDAVILGGSPLHQIALIHGDSKDSGIERVALNAAGTLLATLDLNNRIRIWRTSDGDLVRTFIPRLPLATDISWSPSGPDLVVSGQGGMVLYDGADGHLIQTIPAAGSPADASARHCLATYDSSCSPVLQPQIVSPTRVLANASDSGLSLYDSRTGRRITTVSPGGTGSSTLIPAVAANGMSFAISTNEGDVQVYSAATGDPIGVPLELDPVAVGQTGELPIALTADGRVLLADDGGELSAYEVDTGDLLAQQAAGTFAVADDGGDLATLTGQTLAAFSCAVCGSANGLLPDAKRELTAPLTPFQKRTYLAGQAPEFTPR